MAEEIQFDRADFATPRALVCRGCQAPIPVEYYAANGQVFCAHCADALRQQLSGPDLSVSRLGQSLLLGLAAAIAGAAVYAAVMIYAHSEWALISIAIGWLVGRAVRLGTDNRGGWPYQVMSALLTYTSICAAYAAGVWYAAGSLSGAQLGKLAVMMFAMPFMGGFENILGWVIIAFGVWQAWKINASVRLVITGPHALGTGPQAGRTVRA